MLTNCRFKWILPAFTLIECLLALLVLGMALFFTTPLIETTIRAEKQLSSYRDQEFEVGMLQLDYEMRGFVYKENAEALCRYQDLEGKVAEFRITNNKFIKSYNGGHHPLLTRIRTVKMTKQPHSILIEFHFRDGGTRYAKVLLEPPPKMEALDTP